LGYFAPYFSAKTSIAVSAAARFGDRLTRLPVEARAGLVGAEVRALAWLAPPLAGGGGNLTQSLLASATPFALLPLLSARRLFLGAASYAAGTPGGLFAPLLVLGAQMGFFFGALCYPSVAAPTAHAILFAAAGMAALFAAVVRAPLTGMILVTEMTGSSTELLPMIAACFSARALAAMLGGAPIYDSLKARTLRLAGKEKRDAASG
jgi:CIC family chloride channel protein